MGLRNFGHFYRTQSSLRVELRRAFGGAPLDGGPGHGSCQGQDISRLQPPGRSPRAPRRSWSNNNLKLTRLAFVTVCGECQTGADVLQSKLRKVCEDFGFTHSGPKVLAHVVDGDPRVSNRGLGGCPLSGSHQQRLCRLATFLEQSPQRS